MKIFEAKLQNIIKAKAVLIYGAKNIAIEVIEDLKGIDSSINLIGCAVSNMDGNENDLGGLPVKAIADYRLELKEIYILIALDVDFHEIVEKELRERGYKKIYKIDSEFRNFLIRKMIKTQLQCFLKQNER